ncbi:DUF4837 family protein [Lutimonas saemankumensis]|uniref:DUF4837 family protein n=1 Tax=Lutimonas saemankumensis TaxID=483016 RepID=UPI001CD80960|nr:DUF4837 family protein [Lutimonas saemankumensis]MCA0933461.1 DUF4837 family protein [Lutimonas saemankumensis]
MLKRITLFLLILGVMISCEKSDKVTLVSSTGRINHVLIVMNNEDWDGKIGDELKKIIGQPVLGLPQEENQFSINQVDPVTFNSLFKRNRNILFVGLDKEENFYTNHDVYASPQTTLTILGKDKEELIQNIRSHEDDIIGIFKKNDLALYQKKVTKDFHNPEEIETLNALGIRMKIPFEYKQVEDSGQFLWYRNTFERGLLNIIAYEIPFIEESFSEESLVSFRDSIGKNYIPGQFENTYMRTEPQFKPVTETVEFNNFKSLESRGLWFVEGDYMGGPFISYTIEDEENDRLIVVEGFSYSPGSKKRDVVFELEAILKTIELK